MIGERSLLTLDAHTTKGKVTIAAAFVVGTLAAWALAAHFLPDGAPPGQVVQGLVIGGLNSLVAMGLIIIYRSIRVINFAQAALGSVASALAILLVTGLHWSYWIAVPLGIIAAVVIGYLVDLMIQWRLGRAPRLIVTVATIGVAEILGFIALEMPHLFRGTLSPFSTFKTPFTAHFTIRPIVFTGDDVVAMAVVPIALGLLYWFFVRTDTGVAIRGAADSSERAQLLGIPVRNLTRIAWMVAAGLSGVGAILTQPINGVGLGQFDIAAAMMAPLAAFVLAGMESLPMAVLWSLVIGIVEQVTDASYGSFVYAQVALFVLILIGLLLQRSKQVRLTDTGLGDYVAVREVAPIPRVLANLKEIRAGKFVLLAVVAGVAIAVPWLAGASSTSAAVTSMVYAIIAVSMVILVGWAGQISLGQFAFAGLGACIAGAFMVHLHLPFLLAMLVGGVAGAVTAGLVGIPALRLEGTALAVVTLAFAVVMSTYVLSSQYFPWLDPARVNPPVLLKRFSLATPYTSLYEFGALVLVLSILAATALRRSRSGRTILSVRDNSRASSAYGISPLKSKLMAFGISGFVAGLAGAIYVVHEGGISSNGFSATFSIVVFIMVVIGGLGSATGSVIGAAYITIVSTQLSGAWQYLGSGAGVLVVLLILPEGFGGLLFAARDWIVAQVARAKGLSPTGEPLAGIGSATPSVGPAGGPALGPALGPAGGPAGAMAPAGGVGAVAHTAALRLGALEDLELHGGAAISAGSGGVNAEPPEGRPALVSIADVDAGYGNSQVLFDVGMGVAQREVVALLGTNGAGKTTILRTLSGLLRPAKGRVSFLGRDVTTLDPVDRVRSGLVTVLGGRGIFPSLTVEENLRLAAWTARRHHRDLIFANAATERVLSLFPVLRSRQKQRAGLLSGGEQQMLALGQALLCRPRLLLIDELSLGLAPTVVADLLEVIRALAASGVTVVVVEQSVNVATAISNRAIFMERGRVRFSGPTPDLSEQPELLRSVFIHAAGRAQKRKGAGTGTATGAGSAAGSSVGPASQPGFGSASSRADAVLAALAGGAGEPGGASSLPAGSTGTASSPRITDVAPITDGAESTPAEASSGWRLASGGGALSVLGISKQFGGVAALTDVTLSVAPGEILGIIGSNGAGKTTLFDVCSGFITPDSGRILLDGVDITNTSPAQRALKGIGRVFQDARLWPSMSVREAIATALERFAPVKDPLAAALYLAEVERSEEIVDEKAQSLIAEFGLERFQERYVSELSTGTRRIVELACAVAHEPRVLLLDEPTSGIAQRESEALAELLLGLREQTGATFVIIEHDVPLVSSLADRMVCLHLGEVIAEGETTEVLSNPVVVSAYLGADASAVHRSGPLSPARPGTEPAPVGAFGPPPGSPPLAPPAPPVGTPSGIPS
ncbi:MAG: ATP-binding cassette domain-containing protein [Actinomycetota bacterium]|nr:ATP-binding cassette domain-containing protein [Actinomycetota bacterium]